MSKNIQEKLYTSIQNQQSFVLFSSPDQTDFQLWLNDSDESDFEFIFHSFDNQTEKIIKTNQVLTLDLDELNALDFNLNYDFSDTNSPISHEQYLGLIAKTTQVLQDSDLKKVVISRIKDIEKNDFNIWKTLVALRKAYPKAFVYFFYDQTDCAWFGATPELLMSREANEVKTVSLAGTKTKENEWTSKEFDEQQVVTDFIVDNLTDFGKVKTDGPHTIDAGFFNHLKTYIQLTIEDDFLSKQILEKLHPTPAVGGFPKDLAVKYILENETYDRKFYAGYLGYKIKNRENYFVNLRCAEVFSQSIRLYVGGGIMPDSNPEKEWIETELKSKTLGAVLDLK